MLAILAVAKSSTDHRFVIDYSIDRRTIPRVSYADVLAGQVPADALRAT